MRVTINSVYITFLADLRSDKLRTSSVSLLHNHLCAINSSVRHVPRKSGCSESCRICTKVFSLEIQRFSVQSFSSEKAETHIISSALTL